MSVPTVPTIYATAGTVLTIDPVAKAVVASLSGFTSPFNLDAFPSGAQVWVTQNTPTDHVDAIDASTNTNLGAITATNFNSIDVCFSPDSSVGYVLTLVATAWTVQSIDTATQLQIGTISGTGASGGTSHICISPDGSTLYVSLPGAGTVAVIDSASMTLITTISGSAGDPLFAGGVKCNHAGTFLYAAASKNTPPNLGAYVLIVDMSTNTISGQIDLHTLGNSTRQLAISLDDSFAYVTSNPPSGGAPTLLVKLDLTTSTVVGVTSGASFSNLEGLVITPDMTTVFVCDNANNAIDYCDTASNSFTGAVTGTTAGPIGICITNPTSTAQIVMVI